MSESQVIVYESKRTNVFVRNVMFVSIIFNIYAITKMFFARNAV